MTCAETKSCRSCFPLSSTLLLPHGADDLESGLQPRPGAFNQPGGGGGGGGGGGNTTHAPWATKVNAAARACPPQS